jgi:hypothetical protein
MEATSMFKAIELDATSRQRTRREYVLDAETRQEAIDELLQRLGKTASEAHVDPTRTLVEVDRSLWTIVGARAAAAQEEPGVRRAGAKHKRVR